MTPSSDHRAHKRNLPFRHPHALPGGADPWLRQERNMDLFVRACLKHVIHKIIRHRYILKDMIYPENSAYHNCQDISYPSEWLMSLMVQNGTCGSPE